MDEMLAHRLVEEANQMYRLLTRYQYDRRSGREDYDDPLVECATIGCSLLGNEVYMSALVSDELRFQEMAEANGEDVRNILMGVDYFGLFLRAETSLLRQAGIDQPLIKIIARYCDEAREGVIRGELGAGESHVALGPV